MVYENVNLARGLPQIRQLLMLILFLLNYWLRKLQCLEIQMLSFHKKCRYVKVCPCRYGRCRSCITTTSLGYSGLAFFSAFKTASLKSKTLCKGLPK